MANLFLESFDNIVTTNDLIAKSYTNIGGSFSVSSFGRTGSSLKVDAAFGPTSIYKILPANYPVLIFGTSFFTNAAFPTPVTILSFCDSGTDQVIVKVDSIGRLSFYNGNSILLGTSNKAYDRGAFYYLEFKVVFSSSSGAILYRVNGVAGTPITGINTNTTGSSICNMIKIWSSGLYFTDNFPMYFDDMYANDTTGSDNNDYMGDVRIFVDRPAAAAGATQWAVTGAASNALAVGDVTPDGDTSYISSNTAGQVDLYTLTAPPSGLGVVKAVQTNLVARKDDGIIRQIAPVLGDGVHTNSVGAQVSIGNNYVDYLQSFDRNPLTGAVWAVGDLSTLQLGVKEVA